MGYGSTAVLRRGEHSPGTHRMSCLPMACSTPTSSMHFPLKHIKKWLYWVPAEYWVLRSAYRVLVYLQSREAAGGAEFLAAPMERRMSCHTGQAGPPGDPEVQRRAFFAKCPAVEGKRFLLFLGASIARRDATF